MRIGREARSPGGCGAPGLTLDDDLVAPANLVETSLELLDRDGAQQLDPLGGSSPSAVLPSTGK